MGEIERVEIIPFKRLDDVKILLKKGADGSDGAGIASIVKTGTSGLVDTYRITLTNGDIYTYNVTNGNGITSIAKTGTVGLVDTYTITFDNGNTETFTVTNGADAAGSTNLAYVEGSAVASKNYVVGDYLILEDVLYKVTAAISSGAALVVNTNITAAVVCDQLKTHEDNIPWIGTCSTASGTAAKVATLSEAPGTFNLINGTKVRILFTNENEAANPTLNVNGTGAYPITTRGNSGNKIKHSWGSSTAVEFIFDNSCWIMSPQAIDIEYLRKFISYEEGSTASQAYKVGEYILSGNNLYEVIQDISAGDSFVVNINVDVAYITDALSALIYNRELSLSAVSSDWSASANAQGYYTNTIDIGDKAFVGQTPDVILSPGATTAETAAFRSICNPNGYAEISGTNCILYAKKKPTTTFSIILRGYYVDLPQPD